MRKFGKCFSLVHLNCYCSQPMWADNCLLVALMQTDRKRSINASYRWMLPMALENKLPKRERPCLRRRLSIPSHKISFGIWPVYCTFYAEEQRALESKSRWLIEVITSVTNQLTSAPAPMQHPDNGWTAKVTCLYLIRDWETPYQANWKVSHQFGSDTESLKNLFPGFGDR